MSKSVVVTGASGFLGGAVVRALYARKANVLAVARRPIPGGIEVRHYSEAPAGQVLIHLAENNDRGNVEASGAAYETATQRTLESLLTKRYERVVYASSALLYGSAGASPRKASDPIHVVDAYTRVKRGSEEAVLGSGNGVAARFANLYGKGMAETSVLHAILGQIPGTGPLRVMDDRPVRDFLWIEDAAAALAAMALQEGAPGIYNVGSGNGISIGELARLVLQVAGEADRPVVAVRPADKAARIVLDISDTTRTWQWHPKTELREGLVRLVARSIGSVKA